MDKRTEDLDYNTIMTVLIFILTFMYVFLQTRRQRGVPPGPPLFPIIGNLPSLMTKDTLGRLAELRKRYGDIYGIYTGGKLVVFLNGYIMIHDALVKKGSLFMERARPNFMENHVVHTTGLLFTKGKLWRENRSFTLAALQALCYSDKRFVENMINDEVCKLKDTLCVFEGPFDVERYLNASIANIIFQVVYGHRYNLQDDEIYRFQTTIREFSHLFLKMNVAVDCLPLLKSLPGDLLGIKKIEKAFDQIINSLDKLIQKLKNKSEKDNISQTYVELHADRFSANKDETPGAYDQDNLRMCAYHLVIAGSETTASVIRWIILYLIRNPDVQEKIYSEIISVVGPDDSLMLTDRERLPYTHAVVLEGLRISHIAPLAMPHTVAHDTVFHGYNMPGDCAVVLNLSTILMDPDIWPEPQKFQPERFLNSDGSEVSVPKEFIPFGLGPRACLGETLARTELFLFVTGLVQKLRFLPEQDGVLPDCKGELATTYNAKEFKMRVVAR